MWHIADILTLTLKKQVKIHWENLWVNIGTKNHYDAFQNRRQKQKKKRQK